MSLLKNSADSWYWGKISVSFKSNPTLASFSTRCFLVVVVSLVQNLTGRPDAFNLEVIIQPVTCTAFELLSVIKNKSKQIIGNQLHQNAYKGNKRLSNRSKHLASAYQQ